MADRDDTGLQALIEVAVPVPVYATFTYQVPSRLQDAVAVGKRVLVPFGRRRLTGYVLGPANATPESAKIKPIADVLDEQPIFTKGLLNLLRWASEYYIHPIGEVIETALPSGLSVVEQTRFHVTDTGRQALAQEKLEALTRAIYQHLDQAPCPLAQLQHKVSPKVTRAMLNAGVKKGWLEQRKHLVGQGTRAKTERFVDAIAFDRQRVRLSAQREKILALLHSSGPMSVADLKTHWPTADSLVRAMARDGQVVLQERQVYRDPLGAPITPDQAPVLTVEQQNAVAEISSAFGNGYQTFLLAGVTSSGKTEVYLHLAAQALARQLPVLVLVPEIALIIQMERAFRARFGDRVALLHSGLSNGERYDQWLRLLRGEAHIAVGARSAIFAPFKRVGLIIVDEEHDDAYKQEGALRYHARDLAVVRARQDGAVAILGSATPSLQSVFNVKTHKFKQVALTERIDQRTLPEIFIQDLTQSLEESGVQRFLTPTLVGAMQATLARGEQVLLFLNRRGFAGTLVCATCGQPLRCDRCDISLTYHQACNSYKCHYCGFSCAAAATCTHCGSAKIKRLGLGTEKLEVEIQQRFPAAKVARMDRDTTRRKGAIFKLLKALRDRRIDILVGTQMVAKGHDYPHITLVGIICADLSLSMPDFRAGERTFQLLAQVAGRAGRGLSPGKVILQTYNPNHFSIEASRHQDYKAFYRQEIEFRKALKYPPFTRMVQLRISGRDARQTAAHARTIGAHCQRLQQSRAGYAPIEVLGPLEAPLARIANRYRWQLLLKGPQVGVLHRLVREVLFGPHAVAKKHDLTVSVDVDPVFLM
jgi:primosomal protein N' (replication factor Y) (superfamily II helicase)